MQAQTLHQTCSSRFLGSSASLRSKAFTDARVQRGSLQVQAAITKEKKEKIVSTLKGKLETSSVIFSVRFKEINVETQQRIRKGLPGTSSAYVCKNTLMRVAANEVGLPEVAQEGCKGENMWIFVPEDDIKEAVKFWFALEEDLYKAAKANAPKGEDPPRPTSVGSAFLDKAYITPEQLKNCENMPTKLELYATIAGLVKQVPTRLARAINGVPTKLAYGMKAVADLDEDKSKKAIDAVKPTEA